MDMKISTFRHFAADSLRNLKRNRTLTIASVATVAATLFILGIMILILLTVRRGVSEVESSIEAKIILKDDITVSDKKDIESKLKSMNEVTDVTYETKDEALRKFKEQLGDQYKSLAEGYDKKNPMPDSYIVKVRNPENISAVVNSIKDMNGIETIKDGKKIVDLIADFSRTIKWIGIVILVIFIGLSLFLIGNTIKITLYSRRKEINIMKYIGATDWFIRWPFIMEGMIIGIIGAVLSIVLLYYGYGFLYVKISKGLMFANLVQPYYILTNMLWLFILAGVCIGSFGSFASIRKFLNV